LNGVQRHAYGPLTAGALLLAATVCSVLVASAQAATYTVHSCKTPDGQPASIGAWTRTVVGSSNLAADYCSRGSFYLLYMAGGVPHRPGDLNELVFAAPPDTRIRRYAIWRGVIVSRSSAFNYSYRLLEGDPRAGRYQLREQCEGGAGCHALGFWKYGLIDSNKVASVRVRSLTRLVLSLGCRSSVDCGALTNGDAPAKLWLLRSDVELEDVTDPEITSVSGAALSGSAPLTGAPPVSITASDRGGGVYEAIAEIDGRQVSSAVLDANGGRCRRPFVAAEPCKRVASGTLGIDTTGVADGKHSLSLLVSDATGQNLGVWGPIEITTSNGACSPTPRVRTLRLTAAVRLRRGRRSVLARSVRLRRGRVATVRGRLVTKLGAPVPSGAVCVASRDARVGAEMRARASLKTDADGRFSYRLPSGPARRVYFVHRVSGGAVVASVMVRVPARVRLRASDRHLRNGQRLILSGSLVGRPLPRNGVLVELQARRPAGWQTFATARSGRAGRFRFAYRFTRTLGVQTYALRALVRRQSQYAYSTGASRPVRVRVRG
jgi:hypothetical protein